MTNDSPIPTLFEHCCTVYKAMRERAKTENIATHDAEEGESVEAQVGILVYEGHLTQLFAELGLAVPYYTSVMSWLKDMHCVSQLRRGGGAAQSKWQLHGMPTEQSWSAVEERRPAKRTKRASEYDIVMQQLRDTEKRVKELEGNQQTLVNAINQLNDKWMELHNERQQERV